MTPYPHPIGARVRGANCVGQRFEADVIEHRGPYSVILSDGYVTPVELIREVVVIDGAELSGIKNTFLIPEKAPQADELDLGSWEDEQGEAA